MLYFALFAIALCYGAEAQNLQAINDEWTVESTYDYATCVKNLPSGLRGEDATFMNSVNEYYLIMADEIYFNRIINVFLDGKEDKPVKDVRCMFDSPCITMSNGPLIDGKMTENITVGCLKHRMPFRSEVVDGGVIHSVFSNKIKDILFVTSVAGFTDQKSYFIYFTCYGDGTNGYQVFATKPTLDKVSKAEIRQYLVNAGFDLFGTVTGYRSSRCSNTPAQDRNLP